MLSPEGGGVCLICGSSPMGGVITPPERLKSELLDPLAGGTAGEFDFLAPCSSAGMAAVRKPRKAIARNHILPIVTSKGVLTRSKHCKCAANAAFAGKTGAGCWIRLGSGSLVRYPGIPRPHRTRRRRRDSNEPQPTDRRSGLFVASRWRIS
jgi:hypothetical protein